MTSRHHIYSLKENATIKAPRPANCHELAIPATTNLQEPDCLKYLALDQEVLTCASKTPSFLSWVFYCASGVIVLHSVGFHRWTRRPKAVVDPKFRETPDPREVT
jgi:hypothetical protein